MTLPVHVNSREKNKFFEDTDGNVAVRVGGASRPQGLNTGGIITVVALNDSTWTALPATALTNRNAIAVQNRSGTEIKINYNNAQAGYVGMIIPDGGERFYDITDDILIYGKSTSGTPSVNVEEIA